MADRWEAVWAVANGWQRVALIALVVATFVQSLFILIYATRPWWRARVGRALFLKSTSLCVVLWLTLIGTFYIYPAENVVNALALCLVAVAVTYQLAVLLLSPRNPNR